MNREITNNSPRANWPLAVLMGTGVGINYMDRILMAQAILIIAREWDLSIPWQGVLLSSFYWGYVAFMIPGGLCSDRYGPRVTNAVAAVGWSIATALGGLSGNAMALLFTRVLVGGLEAPIFPANAKVVREHFGLEHRGLATSVFDSGSYVGAALGAPFAAVLIVALGWRATFLCFGFVGIVWAVCWYVAWGYLVPETKLPQIQPKRAVFVEDRWWHLLRERKIVAISLGFFCYNYVKNFYLTWFPSFLVKSKGMKFLESGKYESIPPGVAIVCLLAVGALTDRLIRSGVSVTIARRAPLCIGMLGSSVVLIAGMVDDKALVIVALSIAYGCLISASTGIWALPGDLAGNRNRVSTIGAIQNSFSNVANIIAPIVTGVLWKVSGSFSVPFAVCACFAVLGAFSYWFLLGEVRPIDDVDS